MGEVCKGNEKCVLKYDQEQSHFHYLKAEERKEKMGKGRERTNTSYLCMKVIQDISRTH
jgi:hypothetical protein